jgi:hypothetical protein
MIQLQVARFAAPAWAGVSDLSFWQFRSVRIASSFVRKKVES